MKSILQENKQCFICSSTQNLELHHCVHGTANRKIADREGLTVFLCHSCHAKVHDSDREMDLELIQYAQTIFEQSHTRDEWRQAFNKSWL